MFDFLKKPRNLAILGLMLAVTIILDSTPLGAIPLGAISAIITHIPTIITGIILGPAAGFIMGTSLGVVLMLHALLRPLSPFDPLFINPLISVLPRMFIGVAAYYVYFLVSKLIKKDTLKKTVASLAAGIAGSLTNTGLVFLMLYLIYAKEVAEKAGAPFKAILISVFTTNAIAEAAVSAVITSAIVLAYYRIAKKNTLT
ncbi:MAG: ECF transporter S component [Eubacteriales bacterium]|nr:ECF transporter S component [Eubacteriales bacterium]